MPVEGESMALTLQDLTKDNLQAFVDYVDLARQSDLEEFEGEQIDPEQFYEDTLARLGHKRYANVTCILALIDDKVVGRIEYHEYGCYMDGYQMAYISYIYVLKPYRKQGIARKLFKEAEKRMMADDINQYFLIQANNKEASNFYSQFSNVQIDKPVILRKNMND